MKILIALIPAIGWGIVPLIVNKVPKSRPANQIFGLGLGATIVGIIVTLATHPHMSVNIFALSLLSGLFWSVGQIGQFVSYTRIGVSKTMPISTGFQLVGNTIIGVLIFGEWKSQWDYILGIIALILIIIGVALTAIPPTVSTEKLVGKDILFLLATSIGYWIYSAFPKTVHASSEQLFLPQMIGILLGASLYLLFSGQSHAFMEKASWLDLLSGLSWGLGAYTYIVSAQYNGVTAAFIYGQLSVIISTLGGMTLLGEKKEGRELAATLIGLALIVVGAIL